MDARCLKSHFVRAFFQVVGRHRGLHFHTVGQRKGVGPVLFAKEVHRGPWFVAAKDVASQTLLVTARQGILGSSSRGGGLLGVAGSPPALAGVTSRGPNPVDGIVGAGSGGGSGALRLGRSFIVDDVSWIHGAPPPGLEDGQPQRLTVQVGTVSWGRLSTLRLSTFCSRTKTPHGLATKGKGRR